MRKKDLFGLDDDVAVCRGVGNRIWSCSKKDAELRGIRLWLKNEISSRSRRSFDRTISRSKPRVIIFIRDFIGVVKPLDIQPISAKPKRALDGRFLTTVLRARNVHKSSHLHFHNIAQQQNNSDSSREVNFYFSSQGFIEQQIIMMDIELKSFYISL